MNKKVNPYMEIYLCESCNYFSIRYNELPCKDCIMCTDDGIMKTCFYDIKKAIKEDKEEISNCSYCKHE